MRSRPSGSSRGRRSANSGRSSSSSRRRRIADYLDKKRVREEPLDIDWGEGETERDTADSRRFTDPTIAIEDSSVWNQAFEELNDSHKLVICLVRFL